MKWTTTRAFGLSTALLSLVAVLALQGSAAADPVQEAELLGNDTGPGDRIGSSVALFGDVALASAPRWDDTFSDQGAVYVFRRDGMGWAQEDLLIASDPSDDGFGTRVALWDKTALIGMNSDDTSGNRTGAAYVFRHNGTTWVQEAKLFASDAAANSDFGWDVAIEGDVAVVGAPNDDEVGLDAGAVYVFRHNASAWVEEAKLIPTAPAAGDVFGQSVRISGGKIVVGADRDDDNGTESGSAYVFRHNGSAWVQEAKLLASDGAPGDRFGICVGISGDLISVCAPFDDDIGTDLGSAYVFRYDGMTWEEEAKLLPDSALLNGFASNTSAIAVSDDTVVTSNRSESIGYVFRYDGANWAQTDTFVGDDIVPGQPASEQFGFAVSLSGGRAIVGAHVHDHPGIGTDSGAAYVFFIGPTYSCSGFDPPMHAGPVKVRKKRALPLKARLLDAEGALVTDADISAAPVVQVVFTPTGGGVPVDVTGAALPVGLGTEGNVFEFTVEQKWQYNLKTTNYSAPGTYTVTMVAGDDYRIDPVCETSFVIE